MQMKRRSNGGYSLIEVLIAMAVLGSVLLSIMSLFVFGRRNVYSGRQMTRATAVATHVVEDLGPMTPVDIFTKFKIVPATTLGTNTVAGVPYANSIVRRKTDFTGTDPGLPLFTRWTDLVATEQMTNGDVALVFVMEPGEMGTPNNPTTTRRIRIRVVTEWSESTRRRQVFLDTIKLNRKIV